MRFPQVIVFESDGRLALQLAPLVAARKWVLRESRQVAACERLLAEGGQTVFVVRLAESPEPGLELLAKVAQKLPGVRSIAVGGSEQSTVLAGLAWDLGADFALCPPMSGEQLPDIVAGLMGLPEAET